MHLALIDASLGTSRPKRNFRREIEAPLTVYDVNEGDRPPPVGEAPSTESAPFDAAIISGSQSSVYDDHRPWIQDLRSWVSGALADGLPILGVCWGHQLLAQVLGGTVRGGTYELGYVSVCQEQADPLWAGLPDPFTAFATHSDHVVELPPDADLLASNETGVQAFRQDHAYGVQFHPEYDRHTARAMIRAKSLPEESLQAARDTCTDENVRAAQTTTQVLDNFLAHVVSPRAFPSPTPNA
jgi:GMP synthase (glutamine-hydrolysing)